MKFLSSTRIAAVILLLIAPAFSLHAQNHIIGKWLSEDEEGVTEVYKQGDRFFGKITWLKKPNNVNGKPFTDTENPEKSLRSRMLLGLFILQGLIT
jgi:hypothetical protein